MKTSFRKLASAALSLAMAISCIPQTFAAETAPTPMIHYDFTGLTKTETTYELVKANKIDSAEYPLRVEAGDYQKSRIAKVSDDIYAADKDVIEFDARTYLRIVDKTSTDATSNFVDVDDLFDGAFTFETWLWMKDSTSLNHQNSAGKPILAVSDGSTYNLKFKLVDSTDDGKAYFEFDRTFSAGGGVKLKSQAVVEYGKWNHIVVSYDPSSSLNKPVICLNGETVSDLTYFGTLPAETETARTGENYTMNTKIGQENTTAQSIEKAKWADIKIYNTNISAADAYNAYAASVATFEDNYNLKIKDISGNVISGDALKTMQDVGNTIEFTANDGDEYSIENFVLYDATDDKELGLEMDQEENTATISGFKLTKNHSYKLYVKPVKDSNGKAYRTTDQVIEFTCTKSDDIPAPYLAYDFGSVTKKGNEKATVAPTTGSTGTYSLFVDASTTHPSTIATADNDYANPMSAITFGNRTYMSIVDAANDNADVKTMLDGAFTFETWIKVPNKDAFKTYSTELNGSPILRVGNASTYNLSIEVQNWIDGEHEGMGITFDRTYSNGSGKKVWVNKPIMNYGEWNHIVVSYNPESITSLPTIVVNGVDYSSQLADFGSNITENDTPRSSADYSDFTTKLGQGGSHASSTWKSSYANIKFYSENLTAKQAKALYVNYAAPSAVPTAWASYSFNGLTKDAAEQMWIANANSTDSTKAALFVDASADVSGGNPSWIQQTDSLNLADTDKDNIWFKNYTYLSVKNGSKESSANSTDAMNVLDGASTVEMWVNIPSAASLTKNGSAAYDCSPLLSYAAAGTWLYRIWPVADSDTDTFKLYFSRIMTSANNETKVSTTGSFAFGEWNHIIVSFDPTAPQNVPTIVVNGENQAVTATTCTNLTAEAYPKKYTEVTNPYLKFGMSDNANYALKDVNFGDIKIYDQTLNVKQAKNEYNATKAAYTDINDVEFVKNAEGKYYAKVSMKDTLSAVPFAAIAVYTDGRMTDVALATSLVSGENAFTTGAVTAPEGSTVRVITMNSSSALKPLLKVAEHTIPTTSAE